MRKFLYARNAADAANTIIAVPFDSIRSMHLTGATALKIQFIGDDAGLGSAIFTITTGKSLEVMKAIVNSQRSSSMAFVSIGDDTTSKYIHENLTDVGTINFSG
tara:strand:+ start:3991 stop:4302 length:312 start_codon:yes stop_codon:yes gene_type:complete